MKKTTDIPLTKLADAAFEQAAQMVIKLAQQSGTPVILWEDEAVIEVEPQRARVIRDRKKPAANRRR